MKENIIKLEDSGYTIVIKESDEVPAQGVIIDIYEPNGVEFNGDPIKTIPIWFDDLKK